MFIFAVCCEGALELLALVPHHPVSWLWAKDRVAPLIAELEAELSPDVVAAAWERVRARDLESTVVGLHVWYQTGLTERRVAPM